MLDVAGFHEIVSGRRRGTLAQTARAVLRAAAWPYAVAIGCRNLRYDREHAEVHRLTVPVISVGNLTVGGTGKTPLVAWLARWFRQHRLRVALISRGYKAEAGSRNDEALELERQLPDVPHLQDPDRVAAARVAIEECASQVILLDDGFQHRRLHRDLDIVLIDALEPFGFNHLLPRGLLREPPTGLRRADIVALSRADLVDPCVRAQIWERVHRYNSNSLEVEICHQPQGLVSWSQARQSLESLRSLRLAAFCGIGNPEGFARTLEHCGLEPLAFRPFPDHHDYQRRDLEHLSDWAADHNVDALLCTAKDLVKLQVDQLGRWPLWALEIGIHFLQGRDAFEARLLEILE